MVPQQHRWSIKQVGSALLLTFAYKSASASIADGQQLKHYDICYFSTSPADLFKLMMFRDTT